MTLTAALPQTTSASNPSANWCPYAIVGMAYGVIIMGLFGCLWLLWGLSALNLRVPAIVVAVAAFGVSLWIRGFALLRTGSQTIKKSAPLTAHGKREQSRMGRTFGLIFGAEGLLIFLAVNVLNNMHLGEYAVSAIASIVGLHFLPLARLYRRPMYTVVGIIMVVAALLSLAVPASLRTGTLALTMSAILWITCMLVVRKGFTLAGELCTLGDR